MVELLSCILHRLGPAIPTSLSEWRAVQNTLGSISVSNTWQCDGCNRGIAQSGCWGTLPLYLLVSFSIENFVQLLNQPEWPRCHGSQALIFKVGLERSSSDLKSWQQGVAWQATRSAGAPALDLPPTMQERPHLYLEMGSLKSSVELAKFHE